MTKYNLHKELDKNKFFVIKYASIINLSILFIISLMLYEIKIENYSILEMIINYYINKK